MTTNSIIFDIETSALSAEELQLFMPIEWALGNIKDPQKVAAAIEAKQKAWLDDAALSALTGRVLAIGLYISDTFVLVSEPATEAQMLHEFWDAVRGNGELHRLAGFNILSFDLPFLMRRSWKLGVEVPPAVRSCVRGRWYWSENIIDLREVWQCGDRQAEGSLDTIAKHLGIGAKTGKGSEFSALWHSDREKAIAYLKNDVMLTAGIAKKLGVL